MRVWMYISACSVKPKLAAAMAGLVTTSSIHCPVPSSLNFATYSLPASRYLSPMAMRSVALASAGFQVAVDTHL